METHKSKTKFGGEIIIHTDCSLNELQEQIPSTGAFKQKGIRKLEKMEAENNVKIEKLEAKLHALKDEQGQIIETLAKLKWRKEVTML